MIPLRIKNYALIERIKTIDNSFDAIGQKKMALMGNFSQQPDENKQFRHI